MPLLTSLVWLLVGSYQPATSQGIQLFTFDPDTGNVTYVGGTEGISNPSFLTVSNDHRFVYAVGEDDGLTSTANALSLDLASGTLQLLNSQLAQGGAPCNRRSMPISSRREAVPTSTSRPTVSFSMPRIGFVATASPSGVSRPMEHLPTSAINLREFIRATSRCRPTANSCSSPVAIRTISSSIFAIRLPASSPTQVSASPSALRFSSLSYQIRPLPPRNSRNRIRKCNSPAKHTSSKCEATFRWRFLCHQQVGRAFRPPIGFH